MIFTKKLIGNSVAGAAQFAEMQKMRKAHALQEKMFIRNGQLVANEGAIPKSVYQSFDDEAVERFKLDEGDGFLDILLPRSKSINIGKLVHKFRQASDAGRAQTSMTGQLTPQMDNVAHSYDGSLVPIQDAGFGRNWREFEAQRSEGFDGLIDDNRETTSTLRQHVADSFLDGHRDKNGNIIVADGIKWEGMRNDSRVNQIALGAGGVNFDFSDKSQSGSDIKEKFMEIRDTMSITNKVVADLVYVVSPEIGSAWELRFNDAYDSRTVFDELNSLRGVGSIVVSSKLTGNEIMAFGQNVRPVVGMAVNTVALPRPVYNSNYDFIVWSAIGWEVRSDYFGKSATLFAQ